MASPSLSTALITPIGAGGSAGTMHASPPCIAGGGRAEELSPKALQMAPEIIKFALKRIDEFARSPTETLDLSKLGLSHISDDMTSAITSKIPELRALDLSQNSLQQIPCDLLKKLPRLLSLDLSHNKISSISDSFEHVPILSAIVLSHNMITKIPESTARLHFLSTLQVDANPIVSIAETVIRKNGLVISLTKNTFTEPYETETLSRIKFGLDSAIIDFKK